MKKSIPWNTPVKGFTQAIPSPKNPQIPQLKLNGILWSHIPTRRVALINDRYLKEGEKIKDVSVVKIEKKSVTLQLGKKKWTLRISK